MLVFRPIVLSDTEQLENLICSEEGLQNTKGIDNLPKSSEELKICIKNSIEALSQNLREPAGEKYFFVLENDHTKEICGISAIFSAPNSGAPRYFYRVEKIQKGLKGLRIAHNDTAVSEICAIYMDPKYRGGGGGKLLSLSRFLFIGMHQHLFYKKMMAEMRGYSESGGAIPFWELLARHFVKGLSFDEVMPYLKKNPQAIFDLVPAHPLYISLLKDKVVEAIGKIHNETIPAFELLRREGFAPYDEISLFDGGPNLIVDTAKIRIIDSMEQKPVKKIATPPEEISATHLVAKGELLSFRCCYDTVLPYKNGIEISSNTAKLLQIEEGEKLFFAPIKGNVSWKR